MELPMARAVLALPLLLLLLAADAVAPLQLEPLEVAYLRTVDGDTLWVTLDGGELRVRLTDREAPELREGSAAAFEAAADLARFCEGRPGGTLTLWVAPGDCADRWGRLLASLTPPEVAE